MKQILLLAAVIIAFAAESHAQRFGWADSSFVFELKVSNEINGHVSASTSLAPGDNADSIVEYKANNQKISTLYQFAYRDPDKCLQFPENLNYINSDRYKYSLNFSAVHNQASYDSLVACLNKEFELKTRKIMTETTVYIMSIKTTADVIILKGKPKPDKSQDSASWRADSIFLKGSLDGRRIANYIMKVTGFYVDIPPYMEKQFYKIDIAEKANGIDERIAALKAHGIILTKSKKKIECVQIANMYSDFDAPASQLKYPPKQLRADADTFFNTVERTHINPYYRVGKETFDRRKAQIYSQLDRPMTKDEFSRLIGTINSSLDAHTQISVPALQARSIFQQLKYDDNLLVFPDVVFRYGKAFTKIEDREVELKSINGVAVTTMTASILKSSPHLPRAVFDYNIEHFFPYYLHSYFDIHSPYSVEYKLGVLTKKADIAGVRLKESASYSFVDSLTAAYRNPVSYRIYPESATAILRINTFDESLPVNALDDTLSIFVNALKESKIENLFIDVSKNGGGKIVTLYYTFNFLRHGALFLDYDRIKKDSLSVNTHILNHRDTVGLPKDDDNLFGGKIFVLQGTQTFSGGDLLCRIVRQNNLGVLIGRNTSQYTKAYMPTSWLNLPYTQITSNCAFEFWDFSKSCKTETAAPDMQWDTDNTFEFSESELNAILSAWSERK